MYEPHCYQRPLVMDGCPLRIKRSPFYFIGVFNYYFTIFRRNFLNDILKSFTTRWVYSRNRNPAICRYSQCTTWKKLLAKDFWVLVHFWTLEIFKRHDFRIKCIVVPKVKRISKSEQAGDQSWCWPYSRSEFGGIGVQKSRSRPQFTTYLIPVRKMPPVNGPQSSEHHKRC